MTTAKGQALDSAINTYFEKLETERQRTCEIARAFRDQFNDTGSLSLTLLDQESPGEARIERSKTMVATSNKEAMYEKDNGRFVCLFSLHHPTHESLHMYGKLHVYEESVEVFCPAGAEKMAASDVNSREAADRFVEWLTAEFGQGVYAGSSFWWII